MNRLEKRAGEIARHKQQIAIGQIGAQLKEELRGVHVDVGQFEIGISGPNLVKRWLSETRLRFVGGTFR